MKIGVYQHYKGNRYKVLGLARDSDDLSEKVVYQALYESELGKNVLFVRDKDDFFSTVTLDGKEVPRFSFVE